jgi:hypothetical protein
MPASNPVRALLRSKSAIFASLLIASCSLAFSQDSFMVRFSSSSFDGVQINRGDFNRDGIPDLIMGNNSGSGGSAISVYLGNGDGTFRAPLDSGAGTAAWDIAVGDFNGDGLLDVAIGGYVNSSQGVLQIMLGNGDGTFRTGQTINVSNIPRAITTGDFDNDGKTDIAFALDQVYLYKGAGDGTFTASGSVKVGNQPLLQQVRVGDFNGDGKTDVAVSDEFGVYVMWGTGPFTFVTKQVASYVLTGNITPVDVNQDHFTDLLTTYYACTQFGSPACPTWQVLLGVNGQQMLKQGFTLKGPDPNQSFGTLTAADINGDGFNDVVALASGNYVSVWLGNPDGTFQSTPLNFSTGTATSSDALVASDFNRDGKIDFAVANPGNFGLAVLLNATPQATCTAGTVSPSITECQPIDYTYTTSPLHVTARSTDTGHKVTTMQVYINNQLYLSQPTNYLNYSVTLPPGDYFVSTKAWDNTGANFRTDRHVSVFNGNPGETCATGAMALNICSPAQNQTTTTSVHVFANSESNAPITSVQVYIDNVKIYDDTSHTTYVDTSFTVAKGSHHIVVKAFDANGKIFSQSRTINAQ